MFSIHTQIIASLLSPSLIVVQTRFSFDVRFAHRETLHHVGAVKQNHQFFFCTTGAAAQPVEHGDVVDGVRRDVVKFIGRNLQAAIGERRFQRRAQHGANLSFGGFAFCQLGADGQLGLLAQ